MAAAGLSAQPSEAEQQLAAQPERPALPEQRLRPDEVPALQARREAQPAPRALPAALLPQARRVPVQFAWEQPASVVQVLSVFRRPPALQRQLLAVPRWSQAPQPLGPRCPSLSSCAHGKPSASRRLSLQLEARSRRPFHRL